MKDFVDLFGQPFKLNYDGNYLFKTCFSAYSSILFMIAIALYGIFNIYTMLQNTDMMLNNYQTIMSDNEELYSLNNTNYFLAFRLVDSIGKDVLDHNYRFYSTLRFESNYSSGNYNKSLNITRCNTTEKNLISGSNDTIMSIDLNNSLLGGNPFSNGKKYSVSTSISLNFTKFMEIAYNWSKDYYLILPLKLYIYYPTTSLNPMNFNKPFLNGIGVDQIFLAGTSNDKFYEMSTQVIEINTDSSYVGNSNNRQIAFTPNFRKFSEDRGPIPLGDGEYYIFNMNFYLDPIKTVYYRKYMKLTDVLNNLNSLSNILFMILGFFLKRYNDYKLKVDFIEKNMMHKEDHDENIINLILNPEEPISVNIHQQDSENPVGIKKKLKVRVSKRIKMENFFNLMICCRRIKSTRKYSDLAEKFYKEFVDARSFILLLAQLKDLKNASLPKYQKIVLNATKIILNPDEMLIMKQDEILFEECFQKLKTKIEEKNYDKIDLMLINNF